MEPSELSIDEILLRMIEGSRPIQFFVGLALVFLLITRFKRIVHLLSDFFLGDMDDARIEFANDQAKLIDQHQVMVKDYQEMIKQYQELLDMLDKTQPSRETQEISNGFEIENGATGKPSQTLHQSNDGDPKP